MMENARIRLHHVVIVSLTALASWNALDSEVLSISPDWERMRWSAMFVEDPQFTFTRDSIATLPLAQPRVLLATAATFLAGVFVLTRIMRDRDPLDGPWVRRACLVHNVVLSVWSLAMFLGTARGALELASGPRGTAALFCAATEADNTGRAFWWSYVYLISKYYELLDTVFVIVRKKPLTFLHTFHHAIVLVMCFLWLDLGLTFTLAGTLFNTGVHVVMYAYYALSIAGIRVSWKAWITRLQIIQFMSSFAISLPYIAMDVSMSSAGIPVLGARCLGARAFAFSSQLNAAFLYLFISFYKSAYKAKRAKADASGAAPAKSKRA